MCDIRMRIKNNGGDLINQINKIEWVVLHIPGYHGYHGYKIKS